MTPIRAISRLALIIFVVEGLLALATAMWGPPLSETYSGVGVAVVHAAVLALVAGSIFYFWILRPFNARRHFSEATLNDVAETLSEGFLMYDPKDRLVLCNSKFRELYAMSSDAFVLGRRFEDILRAAAELGQYPEAVGRMDEWIAERVQQHRNPGAPIERQLPNGRWVKIAETRTSTGYTVGVRTDITELKRREMQLRQSEEQLHQIVASLQEGFVLYDAEDRIVMWNEKWIEIHKELRDVIRVGLTFEELLQFVAERKIYPEAIGREEAFIAERLHRHRNPGEPVIRRAHDDQWFITREVRTGDGGLFGICIDITDLKKAETVAEDARLEAERANRAKTQFLTNMSHELRTPLNAVIGFSDLIQNETLGPVGSTKYRDYAEAINRSGRHLLALISDILDLSKVESGHHELHEETIDVPALVQSVIQLVGQRADDSGIALALQADVDAPALLADGRKLTQILVNLVTNAIKFTEAGGSVTVAASCPADIGYVFEVIDTGIGIAPEDIPRALSQFGQVANSLSRNHDGTGLGLPLTKALVELHGGTFAIRSELGVGTTVTATFPPSRVIRASARSNDNSPAA